MLKAFRQWLIRVLTAPAPATASNTHAVEDVPYLSTSSMVPFDENLLERSRTQWQFGDWASLAALDRDTLQHHPDRAKLALLAAAGHAQLGNATEARQHTRLAQDWGCSKKLISQILISGAHNSLARAAAVGKQQHRALKHFENAIAIGTPGSATNLIAHARANNQLDTLGLLPGSQGRQQQYQALTNLAKQPANPTERNATGLRPTGDAHAFYIQLGKAQEPAPFLLIDSKSLPRSGLHYLKNTLSKVFGEHFSFCEWYQEPGCCKQMPCALKGFATHAQETRQLRIRLIKSHDFDLTDPVYATSPNLRRLVLVRDPLFILTSWFALEQLNTHKAILAANGINVNKIWLAHEKEVLEPAYRLLDEHFNPPSLDDLIAWLEEKSRYIAEFMNKWVKPAIEQPDFNTPVVNYEDIGQFIQSVAHEYRPFIPKNTLHTIDSNLTKVQELFKKRDNAFMTQSENISEYMQKYSDIFNAQALKFK